MDAHLTLTSEQAHALAKSLSGLRVRLRRSDSPWEQMAVIRVNVAREADGEHIVFTASRIASDDVPGARCALEPLPRAEHSISREVSSEERVLAHFWGFVADVSGCGRPTRSQLIRVQSGSSPDGWRSVRVVTPKRRRVAVSGAYKHGGAFQRDVRWSEVWLVG